MTDDPINLDGRRSAAEQIDIEMRRRSADRLSPVANDRESNLERLEDQLLAEPARTWGEVMEKWLFLLEQYAATPAARDERIQKLIRRAIGDMERLRKREERK